MGKYIITAQLNPMGDGNPDFAPDEKLMNGIQADGFMLLTFADGKPRAKIVMGCSTLELATALAYGEDESDGAILQAIAIAEGLKKADAIRKEYDRNRTARTLVDLLAE